MKFLLASAGVKNPSIHKALVDMLDKPIAECKALCIPTAMYALSFDAAYDFAWNFVAGREPQCPMTELGWKSVGMLELSVLPSLDQAIWLPKVQAADVLLASGGDALFLAYWMRQSGLADLLPSLSSVWVGMSAGSMVMAPSIGDFFVGWKPPSGVDEALGMVDFAMFPHLDHPDLQYNTTANAEKWAAQMPMPTYAMDDETAIKVVDGQVEVISEGKWKYFPR